MLTNRMRSLKSVDCLQMIYFMDLLFDLTSAVFVMAGAMLDLTKTLSNDAVWQCALDQTKMTVSNQVNYVFSRVLRRMECLLFVCEV